MSALGPWIAGGALASWTFAWTGVVGYVLARVAWQHRQTTGARAKLEPSSTPAEKIRVHLVRPCAGHESRLEERLVSVAHATGLDGIELVVSLTTGRAQDPARPACETAAARLRSHGIEAHVHAYDLEAGGHPPFDGGLGAAPPINQKVGQLACAAREVESDFVLNVDSDVDLSTFDFGPLLARLRGDGVGAVWAVPIESAGQTAADADSAAVLDASLHAFGLLGQLDPRTFVGKVFGVRSTALAAVGGFEALADWLGEDMEMARRMVDAGWVVGQVPTIAHAEVHGRNPDQVVGRYARWLAVIRWQRPHLLATYPLLFFPMPILVLAWAVFGLIVPRFALFAGAAAGWVALVRWALAVGARRASGRTARGALWAGLRADRVIARAWLRCLRSSQVSWRGRVFERGTDGRMVLAQPSP